jgi:spermidine synthase
VQDVTMVDIDERFVNICRTHLPQVHQGAFDDPRVTLRFADIRSFLQLTDRKFDIIILDLNAPSDGGNSIGLYSHEFYQLIYSKLTAEGAMVTYALSAQPGSATGYLKIQEALGDIFEAQCGLTTRLVLDGDWCGFALGFKSSDLFHGSFFNNPTEFAAALSIRNVDTKLRYLDAASLANMLHKPRWISEAYQREKSSIPFNKVELGENQNRYPLSLP